MNNVMNIIVLNGVACAYPITILIGVPFVSSLDQFLAAYKSLVRSTNIIILM